MPYDKRRYADNYDTRKEILKDLVGWACQQCGRKHGEIRKKKRGKGTTVVQVQAHHPDRDPKNPDARLVILCDLCHTASPDDTSERAKNGQRTKRRNERAKMLLAGQLEMFDEQGYTILRVDFPLSQLLQPLPNEVTP